jgi:hypothetical protein
VGTQLDRAKADAKSKLDATAAAKDWPYIFTDNEFEPLIDERFAAIKQGFDRIRGREPRH